jgi:perosamine synthetase
MIDSKAICEMELKFGRFYRAPYVLAVSSGTAALLAALLALRAPRTYTILVQAYSWPQLVSVPAALGYSIDYVDIDGDGRMSLAHLKKKLHDHVGALLICHLFGNPAPTSDIVKLLEPYGIPMIEDCSQSLCSSERGRDVGHFGLFGFCSTGRDKLLSTGEGGLLWTSRPELYSRAFALTQHPQRPQSESLRVKTLFSSLSLRMHPRAAEQGLKSLDGLKHRLLKRSAICEEIRAVLGSIPSIRIPRTGKRCKAFWQHCPVLIPKKLENDFKRFTSNQHPAHLISNDQDLPGAVSFHKRVKFIKTGRNNLEEIYNKAEGMARLLQ